MTVLAVATSLHVAPNPVRFKQQETVQLAETVLDAIGTPIPGAVVTFAAKLPTFVAVSGTGLITSIGPAGRDTVVVSSGTLTVKVPTQVMQVPASFASWPASITMGQGGYFPLRARVLDRIGTAIPGATVSYATPSSTTLAIGSGNFLHSIGALGTGSVVASYVDSVGQLADTVTVTVNQFTAPTGLVVDTFPWNTGVFGVAVSSTRAYVSTIVTAGPLLRLDLPARQFGPSIAGAGSGLSVAFNPAGTTAFVAPLGQDSVAVIDAVANSLDSYVTNHLVGTARDVIVSPDGSRVYVAMDYTEIYVINTASKSVVDSIYVPGLPNHFTFHPSAPLLYVSLDNAQVAEINTDSGKVARLFPTASDNQGTAVAPDGSELYNVTGSNELFVIDLSSGKQLADVHGLGGYGLVASPDGSRLLVAGGVNVKIIDRVNRVLIDSIVVGGGASRIRLTHDGGAAFVSNEAGWVNVIY